MARLRFAADRSRVGNKIPVVRAAQWAWLGACAGEAGELIGRTFFSVRAMLLVRALPFALVLGCVLPGAEEPLPAIFAPKPAIPAPPPPPLIARVVPTSERVSQALAQQIREKAAALDVPTRLAPWVPGDAPVTLERVLVLGEKIKAHQTTEKVTAAERFLRTGRLFETSRMHGDLKLLPVEKVGALPKDDVRVEVGITIKF